MLAYYFRICIQMLRTAQSTICVIPQKCLYNYVDMQKKLDLWKDIKNVYIHLFIHEFKDPKGT